MLSIPEKPGIINTGGISRTSLEHKDRSNSKCPLCFNTSCVNDCRDDGSSKGSSKTYKIIVNTKYVSKTYYS